MASSIRNLGSWLRLAALLGVAAFLATPSFEVVAGVDLPVLEHGKGDRCVDDEDYIRRNHPDLLKHHRDETMHLGIRTTKYSLKKCVECHAGSKTGSVASTKDDFCVACHNYAGVHLDCWDCHATRPAQPKPADTAMQASPLMAATQHGESE